MVKQSRYNKGSRSSDDFEIIHVRLIISTASTELAQLFFKDTTPIWLPRSEITVNETAQPSIKLVDLPLWLARKHGLEDDAE